MSDKKTQAFTLRLTEDMHDWLSDLARREMRTLNDQVRYILMQYRIEQKRREGQAET